MLTNNWRHCLWIEDSIDNRLKLIQSFEDIGIDGIEPLRTIPLLAGYTETYIAKGLYIDLTSDLQFIKQQSFAQCLAGASQFQTDSKVIAKVIDIDTLIREKENSQRPKDQDEAMKLKLIRDGGSDNPV